MNPGMPPEPGFHARVLVGPVVVHDEMQTEFGRSFDIDLLEEAEELLMPMTRHAVADHFAVEHAEGRKQGGRAVAFVVVRHRPTAAFLQRQARLGAIEGLNLTFLVDAQHQGFGTDYTSQLLFETLSSSAPEPDIAMLLRICERLPNSARILATRRRGKQSFELKDEFDAQDLLHSLIRGYFKFSVQEEPLGRVAGGPSSRADIAIEDVGTIIEIKYVHGPADQNRIVEDFAKDLLLYAKWPPLLNFIYLVVNSQDLRDPEALEKLAGDHIVTDKKYRVYVVLV